MDAAFSVYMKFFLPFVIVCGVLLTSCSPTRSTLIQRKADVDVSYDDLSEFRVAHGRTGLGALSAVNYISRRFADAQLQPINGGSFEKRAAGLQASISSFSITIDGDSTLLLPGVDYYVDPTTGPGEVRSSILTRDPTARDAIYLHSGAPGESCIYNGPTLLVSQDLAPPNFNSPNPCRYPVFRITDQALRRASGVAASIPSLVAGEVQAIPLPAEIGLSVEVKSSTSGRWTVAGALAGSHHSKKDRAIVIYAFLNDYTLVGNVQQGVLPPSDAAVAALLELVDEYSHRQLQTQSLPYSMIFAVVQTDGIVPADLTHLERLALWSKDEIVAAINVSSGTVENVDEKIIVEPHHFARLSPVLIPESRTRRRIGKSLGSTDFDVWLSRNPETGLSDFVQRIKAILDQLQGKL